LARHKQFRDAGPFDAIVVGSGIGGLGPLRSWPKRPGSGCWSSSDTTQPAASPRVPSPRLRVGRRRALCRSGPHRGPPARALFSIWRKADVLARYARRVTAWTLTGSASTTSAADQLREAPFDVSSRARRDRSMLHRHPAMSAGLAALLRRESVAPVPQWHPRPGLRAPFLRRGWPDGCSTIWRESRASSRADGTMGRLRPAARPEQFCVHAVIAEHYFGARRIPSEAPARSPRACSRPSNERAVLVKRGRPHPHRRHARHSVHMTDGRPRERHRERRRFERRWIGC
jgi:hypothetical protein